MVTNDVIMSIVKNLSREIDDFNMLYIIHINRNNVMMLCGCIAFTI